MLPPLLALLAPALAAAASLPFPPALQASALASAFPAGQGRRVETARAALRQALEGELEQRGWVEARTLARALAIGVNWTTFEQAVVPVRGPPTVCHAAPNCLDLACRRCYDPLTGQHGPCSLDLSYHRCSDMLLTACLPWTCARPRAAA